MGMSTEQYPSLHQASNAAATEFQRATRRSLRVQLGLTVLASVCGGLTNASSPSLTKPLAITAASALAFSLVLTWVNRAKRYERAWFECRAIAESAKTLAWRYMMGVRPFELTRAAKEVDERFRKRLMEILAARPGASEHLAGHQRDGEAITSTMRAVRALAIADRRAKYLEDRLRDQKAWYQKKAAENKWWDTFWFGLILLSQAGAIAAAIVVAATSALPFNPVGIVTTLSATLVAWTQAKGHRELLSPYAMAADELASQESLVSHMTDDDSLSKFVEEIEEAISREHTMWYAKRTGADYGDRK